MRPRAKSTMGSSQSSGPLLPDTGSQTVSMRHPGVVFDGMRQVSASLARCSLCKEQQYIQVNRALRARSLFMESRTRSIFFYFEHVLHAEPRTLRLNMLLGRGPMHSGLSLRSVLEACG